MRISHLEILGASCPMNILATLTETLVYQRPTMIYDNAPCLSPLWMDKVFLGISLCILRSYGDPSPPDLNTFPRTQPNSFQGVAYPPTICPLVTTKLFVLPSRLWVANSGKGLLGMSPISSSSHQRGINIIPLCSLERWLG